MTIPRPGEKAPDFSLPRDGGGSVSLADFKGRKLVLYFKVPGHAEVVLEVAKAL